MAEAIGASDRAAFVVEDLPVLNVADLDSDPHGMFRRYRACYPFVRHENGGYLVLRHADIQRLGNDPRTAATETMHPVMYGVTEGALFDLFKGNAHRERRHSPSPALTVLQKLRGPNDGRSAAADTEVIGGVDRELVCRWSSRICRSVRSSTFGPRHWRPSRPAARRHPIW